MKKQEQVRGEEKEFADLKHKAALTDKQVARAHRELLTEKHYNVIDASFDGNAEKVSVALVELMRAMYETALVYGIDLDAEFEKKFKEKAKETA